MAGLFVPKPSANADCQHRSVAELEQSVRECPLASRPPLSMAIVTHFVTQSFVRARTARWLVCFGLRITKGHSLGSTGLAISDVVLRLVGCRVRWS
jgi:hypothetical protein